MTGESAVALLESVIALAQANDDEATLHWAQLELGGYYIENPMTDMRPDDRLPKYRQGQGTYFDALGRPMAVDARLAPIQNVPLTFGAVELSNMLDRGDQWFSVAAAERLNRLRQALPIRVTRQVQDFRVSRATLQELDYYIQREAAQRFATLGRKGALPKALPSYFHAEVRRVSGALYRAGHYRNAVMDAFIALVDRVRAQSGRADLDGKGLMTTVFSRATPVLIVSANADEQEGFMHLMAGAVQALRNPPAHSTSVDPTPIEALDMLATASLLFRALDGAKKAVSSAAP